MITIEEFLDRVTANSNTRRNYKGSLNRFFQFLEIKPEEYFTHSRDYEGDLELYIMQMIRNGRAPKTINCELGGIHSYLVRNKVEISGIVIRDIRKKIGPLRPVTNDRTPTVEELRKILTNMDIRGRAFFLTLISSGMRIGEAVKIGINDIIFNSDPVRINLRFGNTKTKASRTAFISNEAKEAILAWLKIRDRYIKIAQGCAKRYNQNYPSIGDKLFPFSVNSGRRMWNEALFFAGLEEIDSETGKRTLHPHGLRHFFRRKAGSVVNRDIAEGLVGHEEGLSAVYANYQRSDAIDEMAKQYKEKVEPVVSIFSDACAINVLNKRIVEQEKRVSYMVSKNMQLEEEIMKNKELQKKLDNLTKRFDAMMSSMSNTDKIE